MANILHFAEISELEFRLYQIHFVGKTLPYDWCSQILRQPNVMQISALLVFQDQYLYNWIHIARVMLVLSNEFCNLVHHTHCKLQPLHPWHESGHKMWTEIAGSLQAPTRRTMEGHRKPEKRLLTKLISCEGAFKRMGWNTGCSKQQQNQRKVLIQ